MQIQEVDGATASDELLAELAETESEGGADLRGHEPARGVDVKIGRYRNPGNAIYRRWLARVDGEAAGMASFEEHGPTFFYGIVKVRPSHRRRGVGKALYAVILDAARERGAPSFFGHHAGDAGAAFARSVAAVDGSPDIKSVLDLRNAELPRVAVPDGIELRSWVAPAPADIVESYVRALAAMDDAPSPEGATYPTWTLERLEEEEQTLVQRGVSQFVTVAIEDGEVLSFTGVRAFPPPAPYAFTEDTGTLPHARRRGLAYLVKCENLGLVRRERPDVEQVGTFNAEENIAMRTVNTKLGFVPSVALTPAVVTL